MPPNLGAITELKVDKWLPHANSAWSEESGVPEDAALLATTHILGVPFHVQAIQVAIEDGNGYAAVDDCFQEELEAAYDISGDSPFCTVEIPGHDGDYVLLIYPHTL